MANWIFDMFSKKPLSKEAASSQGTNREDHFARKLKENDWLAGAMKEADSTEADEVSLIMAYENGELDTPGILNLFSMLVKNGHAWSLQGAYGRAAKALIDNGYLSQDGDILKGADTEASFKLPMVKLAAYTLGDDMKETIEKDYELAVGGMSDYNIAEMLTELACDSGETMLEAADELHAKNVDYVKGNRAAAEKKLLKAVGEHTLVDWKEAFKKFRNAKPYEIKEKELYEDDLKSNKFNEKVPGEKAYDGLSDKEHLKNMDGIGKEEEKGQVGKDASLKTAENICPVCRQKFSTWTEYEAHMKAGHKKPDPAVVERFEKRPDIAPHLISKQIIAAFEGFEGLPEEEKDEFHTFETGLPHEEKDVDLGSAVEKELTELIKREQAEGEPKEEKHDVALLEEALSKVKKFLGHEEKEVENLEPKPEEGDKLEPEAKAPPGFESTVKKLKHHTDKVDNPFALAWWMKDKGYESHPHKKSALTVVAYHAGDKAYYHGKPCTIKDICLNQYSGEANVEIEVEGESFHLSGKELKELGKEALTPELEHPIEEAPVAEPLPDVPVKEDVVVEPEVLAPVEEIASKATKAEVIKKVAEISSPWIVAKDEQGQDVIKRADDQDPAAPKDIQK